MIPPPPPGLPRQAATAGAPEPSAAAAAGAAAAALLQRQLAEDAPKGSDKPNGGWTEHQTGDGRKFYFQEETQTSTWEKPEVLMTAEERKNDTMWREYRIWDGRVFYHNRETKVSCWSMPPEIRRLRGESSGIDETPLPQTAAERRRLFWDILRERAVDETWTWAAVEEACGSEAEAKNLPTEVRKQCFAELLGLSLRQKQIEAREKQRDAANALERLIEERFGNPEDLGTSYEEAASLLENEEPWQMIKSDLRRDEVFQTVMERLEEKHQKARTERRSEQTVRLQRLMATDIDLRRPRLRWKDAAAILSKNDELHEEDPPLEALRVWASLRDLKPASEHEREVKRRLRPDENAIRDERKRRDAFVAALRDLAIKGQLAQNSWFDVEGILKKDPSYTALKEGPGASVMELFDEFQEEIARGVPLEEAGLGFEIDLAMPAESMQPVVVGDAPAAPGASTLASKTEMGPGGVKSELEPAAKRARLETMKMEGPGATAPVAPPAAPPPAAPMQPGLVRTKDEMLAPKGSLLAAKAETQPQAPGMLAAKTETQDPSPLDQLLAAADALAVPVAAGPAGKAAVSTPLTKEELLDPSSKPPASAPQTSAPAPAAAPPPAAAPEAAASVRMAKEEVAESGASDPLAVPAVPMKRAKVEASASETAATPVAQPPPAAAPPAEPEQASAAAPAPAAAVADTGEKFSAAQLMAKKVDDLRELCRARGLPVSGRKQELVDRLAGN